MRSLPHRIMELAEVLPEASPICPNALLHLGRRAAVDQALSRLARSGALRRICRGVYMRPIQTEFGTCSPNIDKAITALSKLWGETIVPNEGAAANVLGLITQVPIHTVYLTSGPNRKLRFGAVRVTLRHAPRWKLALPRRRAGEAIRALSFLGPHEVEDGLAVLLPKLTPAETAELSEARPIMPTWMAEPVSRLIEHA